MIIKPFLSNIKIYFKTKQNSTGMQIENQIGIAKQNLETDAGYMGLQYF